MVKATRQHKYPREIPPDIQKICDRILTATPLELFAAAENLEADTKMALIEALVSHEKSNWETPQWLFDALHREFNFCMDAAASRENAKLPLFIDKDMDTLKTNWAEFQMLHGIYPYQPVFLNPPWGHRAKEDGSREEVYSFVQKAYQEYRENFIDSVLILPNKVETEWYHDFSSHCQEIRIFKGRINYEFQGEKTKNGATVGTLILVFRDQPGVTGPPRICSMSNRPKDYERIL